MWPFFETPACGGLLRMRRKFDAADTSTVLILRSRA
jgi:hypothetical protein